MKRVLPIAAFPALQVACFVGAGWFATEQPWLAGVLFVLAVIALDLTVHIFLHECVHATQPDRTSWATSLGLTLLGGLPFDGYRLHHYNHHRHDNGPGDHSTTWHWEADGRRRPKRLLPYVLLWPLELARARAAMRADAEAGRISAAMQRRLRVEKHAVTLFVLGLAVFSWPWAVAWLALVYGGWALVSLHNYGQHPPVEGLDPVTSFAAPGYNALLFNNGLHGEHHAEPGKPWHELRPVDAYPRSAGPHLIAPFHPRHRTAPPPPVAVEPPRP